MAARPKVIVDPHFRAMGDIFTAEDRARLDGLCEVVWGRDQPMPDDAFAAAAPDAEAVVCADWRYGPENLARAAKLRAILTVSGGFPRRLDFDQCFRRGIRVLSAAPAFAASVAEMALTLALASARDIVSGDRGFRVGKEEWLAAGNRNAFNLYGKPVCMIGYGGIAQALQPLLAPFAVSIRAYDPWLGDGYLKSRGVTPASLDEVLAESRVIFVLAAPSSENQALLSREKLMLIRPDAVLVLVSRAHVVDFDALTEMVVAGRFRAAIDVFPSEPMDAGHPVRTAGSAILSAHKAGGTIEGCLEIGRYVVDDLEAILAGLPPRRMLNAEPEIIGRYVTNTIKQKS
jgi:phosphoglycerate dehydrogenase-like enzyme